MKKFLAIVCAAALLFSGGCAVRAERSPLEGGVGGTAMNETIRTIIDREKSGQQAAEELIPLSDVGVKASIAHKSLPITVEIDAEIEEPDVDMPVVKVRPHQFTQEEVDRAYDALIGDSYFADFDTQSVDGPELRSLIEGCLELVEMGKAASIKQEAVDGDASWEQAYQYERDYYEEELETAQPLDYFPEASREFKSDYEYYEGIPMVIGFMEKDGKPYRLWVKNDPDNTDTFLMYERFPMGFYEGYDYAYASGVTDAQNTPGVDYRKAAQTAQEAADAVSGGQMAIASAKGYVFDSYPQYNYIRFAFSRVAEHAPTNYDTRSVSVDLYNGIEHLENVDYSNYAQPWNYEQFTVCVSSDGVQSLTWTYPYETVETVTESAKLMSFEEIYGVFENMFFVKNSMSEEELNWPYVDEDGNTVCSMDKMQVSITDIRLGMMRVQSGGEYLLVPVWDFYGYKEAWTPEGDDYYAYERTPEEREAMKRQEREQSMLTVNAMDGSIINRDVGY